MGGNLLTALGLVVLLSLALPPAGYAKKIPKWWMKVAQRQGPNACVVEEVPGTGKEFWTECRYWLNRKICGRKTIVRFECCEGFEQIDGENGCTRVKPLINLLETAEALGATRWASYIRESGLANELETAGAYTLFAPTNEAFDSVKSSLKSQLESYRGTPNNPVLLYHIVKTKLPSDHFQANTVVETAHAGNFLRINKYSNGMNTINCALLLQKDQQATNGIVHVIDSVLDPSKSLSDNVAEMVLKDGRFTVMSEMLEKSGYINVLRTMQGSITFLAPSDEAFQKLPDSRREKIINDREARLALIQNHIIPHVICESAITGEHRVRTVSSNKLTFNCDIDGAYVEQSKLRSNFNLGKNGIIHILDDVLLPDRAKNLVELAESRQLFTFAELVRHAGLEETLSHTGDYTFFVPDENAWFELDPDILRKARNDVEFAGLMLRFHGAYGRHLTNALTDNQAIMSLDEENPLRLQVWRRAMGVEDARITTPDVEAQNGVIHIINKVIFPSNETVTATLRSLPGRQSFNTYLDLLQQASSQTPPIVSLRPGDDTFYTFFVPTDAGFENLDTTTKTSLRNGDTETVNSFIKQHLAVNMFPYTSFEPNLIYSIGGMDGSTLNLKKDNEGKLTANGVSVTSSHMSANGVIHVVDDVFTPSSGYGSSFYSSSSSYSTHGGSGGSHYSSSSSRSSSAGSATRTSKTYRKTVTFAEGYDDPANNLPSLPQGSELASSVRGNPELVPSPSAPDTTQIQPSSTGRRRVSSSQHPASVDMSVVGADQIDNTARLHDNSDRYSHTYSSHSVNSENNPDRQAGGNLHEHEPGLEQWERKRDYEIRHNTFEDINTLGEIETNSENDIEHGYAEDLRIQEEHRRKLEIARQDEIRRQEAIKREEELLIEEEKRRELVRQRQEELRLQQEANERIEEENRQRELQNLRLEEARLRQEEQLRIEEENNRRQEEQLRIREQNRLREEQLRIDNERRRQDELVGGNELNRRNQRAGDSSGLYESRWSSSHSYGNNVGGRHEAGSLTRSSDRSSNPLYDENLSNATRSTKITTHESSHNTVGPITPNGTRYSYVGRSYGNDIVGHDDTNTNPIPLTGNGNSNSISRVSTHVHKSEGELGGGLTGTGITTTTTRRKVNVTRTVYSYPSPDGSDRALTGAYIPTGRRNKNKNRQSSNFYRQHQFSYPTRIADKSGSDFVSAYAFTGGETEYADGQEFVESGAPVVATITVNQARALRRNWRKKRQNIRNMALADSPSDSNKDNKNLPPFKNRKGRRRFKKGRGRGLRRGMKRGQRRAMRRLRKKNNNQE